MPRIRVRKGQGDVKLSRTEFQQRLEQHFYDPAFSALQPELERIVDAAWDAYDEYRKSPRTRRAGPGFATPDAQLPIEWLEARAAIRRAERAQQGRGPGRVLLIAGAARHDDDACPRPGHDAGAGDDGHDDVGHDDDHDDGQHG